MIQDILTVMWKERRSFFQVRGSRTRFFMILFSPLAFVTWGPWRAGAHWFSEMSPLLAGLIPVLMVGITVPEAFAGERERHTLGTLLASRLPDRAILLGKMGSSVLFAWALTAFFLLLGALVANLVHWQGHVVFFSTRTLLGNVGLSVVLATLCAGAGVLISQKAHTTQEAAQILMGVFLFIPTLLGPVALAFHRQIGPVLAALGPVRILLILLGSLTILDVVVLSVAVRRFERSRLTLS